MFCYRFDVLAIYYSSFAAHHLEKMNAWQLQQFDRLLNNPESDWQLFYWITGETTTMMLCKTCENMVVHQARKLLLQSLTVRCCRCYKGTVKSESTCTINSHVSP